ncbi:hypothetical protein OS493_007570 [Desmophyllum pertusum]|uniref:Uncharacterized protein n=1 Tax=Desmophyllum pertusum TaxID=174260 RepID=A0A9W9Z4Z4_9CNID|nr:hypothetical protein OS493_007570 [Desmophyllum pertusum]
MASWLEVSRKIEGKEKRLSKIPVRRTTRLNNDSGKSSSSKDQADKNQSLLRDSANKLQNKRSSRIPIVSGLKDDKESRYENTKVQDIDQSAPSVDLSSACKVNREDASEDVNSDDNSCRVIGAKEVFVSGDVLENTRRHYGHLREEVELLKGSLDLCHYREELLRGQVDALEKQTSHCKIVSWPRKATSEPSLLRNSNSLKLKNNPK